MKLVAYRKPKPKPNPNPNPNNQSYKAASYRLLDNHPRCRCRRRGAWNGGYIARTAQLPAPLACWQMEMEMGMCVSVSVSHGGAPNAIPDTMLNP